MKVDNAVRIVICLLCVLAIQGCVGVLATGTAVGAVATQDRRTPGTYIDDELIELKFLAAVSRNESLKSQSHVNATSFNGLVLLTGETPGESLRSQVTEIARGIPKVRGVQNEIALKAPSSLLARTNDTAVTGNVKAALLKDENVNAAQVKVVTERGVVYLMGLLRQDEADRATEVARRLAGVQRVVKVMEYIE